MGRPTPNNKWVPGLRRPILCCCLPEARRGPCSRCHQDCKGTDVAWEWKAMTGCSGDGATPASNNGALDLTFGPHSWT